MVSFKERRVREVSPGEFEVAINEVILFTLQKQGLEPTEKTIADYKRRARQRDIVVMNSQGEPRCVNEWEYIQHNAAILAIWRVRLQEAQNVEKGGRVSRKR